MIISNRIRIIENKAQLSSCGVENTKKVIIAGASAAGLYAAYKLGKAGMKVTVYEKNGYDNLCYDWHDSINENLIKILGFEIGEVDAYLKDEDTVYIMHGSEKIINLKSKEKRYGVNRRSLVHFLFKKASEYADIKFKTEITAPIITDNKVTGLVCNGIKYYADLVIDNLGVFSPLRASLPESFGFEKGTDGDIMCSYRACFNVNEGKLPNIKSKLYLRYLGKNDITWVIAENGVVDIFIGHVGGLSMNEAQETLTKLRQENDIIGNNLIYGGGIYHIPVRYPASKLYCDGYVLLGGSGFMTNPLTGSGLYASVLAADILCKTISGGDFSLNNLYNYQKQFIQCFGKFYYEIDVIRRFLLNVDIRYLAYIIDKNIISEEDVNNARNNLPLNMTFTVIASKLSKGLRKPLFLMKVLRLYNKILAIRKAVNNMPEGYDEKLLISWRTEIEELFNKL